MEVSEPTHVCESCFKTYKRRDLLQRHKRRCNRLRKPSSRRKACNACVQAKAKCSYDQPSCLRCAERGISCQYLPLSTDQVAIAKIKETSVPEARNGDSMSAAHLPGLRDSPAETISDGLEDSSAWDSQMFQWPLDKMDEAPLQLSMMPSAISDFAGLTDPPNPLTPPATVQGVSQGPMLNSSQDRHHAGGVLDLPMPSLAGLDTDITPPLSAPDSIPWEHRLHDIVRLVEQYPRFLLQDDFHSPLLHHELYDENVPDMTTLAHSSMAICCGSGMDSKEGARFVKRAMDVERQRLIESFPKYQCMHQWDALHAMLVYEIIEMRASPDDQTEHWKQKPRAKGLKSPFLVKMTRSFIQYQLDSLDANLVLGTNLSQTCTWNQWTVAETARRTIFLANMVNFLGNHDPETGRQSPYYEPLNDALVLNMALPCSDALWSARTEHEWRRLYQLQQKGPLPTTSDPSSIFDLPAPDTGRIVCLRDLFSNYSKDHLRGKYMKSYGFGNSEELLAFVILCALEQFG